MFYQDGKLKVGKSDLKKGFIFVTGYKNQQELINFQTDIMKMYPGNIVLSYENIHKLNVLRKKHGLKPLDPMKQHPINIHEIKEKTKETVKKKKNAKKGN